MHFVCHRFKEEFYSDFKGFSCRGKVELDIIAEFGPKLSTPMGGIPEGFKDIMQIFMRSGISSSAGLLQ